MILDLFPPLVIGRSCPLLSLESPSMPTGILRRVTEEKHGCMIVQCCVCVGPCSHTPACVCTRAAPWHMESGAWSPRALWGVDAKPRGFESHLWWCRRVGGRPSGVFLHVSISPPPVTWGVTCAAELRATCRAGLAVSVSLRGQEHEQHHTRGCPPSDARDPCAGECCPRRVQSSAPGEGRPGHAPCSPVAPPPRPGAVEGPWQEEAACPTARPHRHVSWVLPAPVSRAVREGVGLRGW